MKYRMGAALGLAAILIGSAMLPTAALADEDVAAAAEPEIAGELQQELEARLKQDAEAMAADAMTAASDLDLPLELARVSVSPLTLVLVSDL